MTLTAPAPRPVAAADLPGLADLIRRASRRAAADLILIGVTLGRVRAALPRGAWVRWCRDEFGWPTTTVYRLLRVGRAFGGLADELLDRFEPSALYALSSPGTPPGVRDHALERAADGERITRSLAFELLAPEPKPAPADPAPGPAPAVKERRPPADPTADPPADPAAVAGAAAWAAVCELLAGGAALHLAAEPDADTGEPDFTGRLYPPGDRRPRVAAAATVEAVVLRLAGREPGKCCGKCGAFKPLEQFPKNACLKDGRVGNCRPCEKVRLAALRAKARAEAAAAGADGGNDDGGDEDRDELAPAAADRPGGDAGELPPADHCRHDPADSAYRPKA